jgi:hypothetical protein
MLARREARGEDVPTVPLTVEADDGGRPPTLGEDKHF